VVNVKEPRSNVTTLIVLAGLSVMFLAVLRSPLENAAGAVCVGLLATELDRSGRLLGLGIVRRATSLLPVRLREGAADEWSDHVLAAGEHGMRPVLVAVSIALLAAPRMAVRYRVRPWVAHRLGDLLYAYASTVSITCRGFSKALRDYSGIEVPEDIDPAEVKRINEPDSATEAIAMAIGLFIFVVAAGVVAVIAAPTTPITFVSSRWRGSKARIRVGTGLASWAGYCAMILQTQTPLHFLGLAFAVSTVAALAAPVCLGMMGGQKNDPCAANRLLAWIEGDVDSPTPQ
jgi:hypothetical protein